MVFICARSNDKRRMSVMHSAHGFDGIFYIYLKTVYNISDVALIFGKFKSRIF